MNINELVGSRIRGLRDARGLTQVELSDAVASLGLSMSRATLIRLEKGERPATVAEVVALALVLVVPPAALVSPVDAGDELVDLTPGTRPSTAQRLYYWWTGLQGPSSHDGYALNSQDTTEAPDALQGLVYSSALRRHVTGLLFAQKFRRLEGLKRMAEWAERDPDVTSPTADELAEARDKIRVFGKQYVGAIREAHSLGLSPYFLPAEWQGSLAASAERPDIADWLQELGVVATEIGHRDE